MAKKTVLDLENVPNQKGTYDEVGFYNQDRVNGLNSEIFSRLYESIQLKDGLRILDHMCRNGNLIKRTLQDFPQLKNCAFYGIDIANKQLEIGRSILGERKAKLQHGDVTSLPFPSNFFDRIVRKSGSHEIPWSDQQKVFSEIARTLKDEGIFVELTMLFENERARNEFREVARKKDTLAGLTELVKNRYFLTGNEIYDSLRKSGFSQVMDAHSFNYHISCNIVGEEYFDGDWRKEEFENFVKDQCPTLWEQGMIIEEDGDFVLRPTAKIIVAKK